MRRELEIWQFIKTHLQQKREVMLMIVVQSSGSSPGRVGFKMAVAGDEICGSIGGGVMEVSLVELAKRGGQNVKGKIIEQVHRKNSPNSSGMICSGWQKVVFLEISPSDLEKVSSILGSIDNYQRGILELTNNGLRFITPEMADFEYQWNSLEGKARFVTDVQDWGYSEKFGYQTNLYIIGGGHCALALSELMSKLDFRINVFDDRPNLNTLEKNRFAQRVEVIDSYENIGDFVPDDEKNYVVVMTLGYKFDEIVIRKLFDKNFKYFGVLGSKAKMRSLLKSLEKNGFDKGKLAKIRAPIGLPINSRTPEEIAISIAAEIIAVKNSRN